MADPRLKKMKIQTGVVKRIAKEKALYEKETTELEANVKQFEQDGGDEYVLKNKKSLHEESKMMIPDCQRRLVKARDELKSLIEEYKAAQDLAQDAEELVEAERQFTESAKVVD